MGDLGEAIPSHFHTEVLNEAQGQLKTFFFSRLDVTIYEFRSLEIFIIGRSLASNNEQDKTPVKQRNYTPVLTGYSKYSRVALFAHMNRTRHTSANL
jgi:hypothetical protein